MKIGIITFPGTLDDQDAMRAVKLANNSLKDANVSEDCEAVSLWHNQEDLQNVDGIIVPGGFSYGDYLRCGAISRFAPIMEKVVDAANGGMPVLGICNGFQILTESHLLPGALTRNNHQKFICRDQKLIVNNTNTLWTSDFELDQEITIPLKNGEGCFVADQKTVEMLESENRIVFRYKDFNPNGSINSIAGVCNEKGNVVGLMPHPEHSVEKGFGAGNLGLGTDGLGFFTSVIKNISSRI